jgi:hypothetical protein
MSDSVSIQFEKRLRVKFDSIKMVNSDSLKQILVNEFQKDLSNFLKNPNSFYYPFDSLKLVGKIRSADNEFRMFNWNVAVNREAFHNFCIIQLNPKNDNECLTFILEDKSDIDQVGNTTLLGKNWYGALYYRIVPVNFDGKVYYTLLGFDSFSPYVSKKVIDVLYFKNGEPVFGAPVINNKGKTLSRIVFSFSARISMMLNYDEAIKTIVFDHLSPSETRYTGQFEYYGPDFSFDGLVLTKEHWLYTEDIKPNLPNFKNSRKSVKSSNSLRQKK